MIDENSNTLLLHWFQKIRQNLLWKETYVALGKLRPSFIKLRLHDTLRDLKEMVRSHHCWFHWHHLGVSEVRSLPGLDTSGLAASILPFPAGLLAWHVASCSWVLQINPFSMLSRMESSSWLSSQSPPHRVEECRGDLKHALMKTSCVANITTLSPTGEADFFFRIYRSTKHFWKDSTNS